MSTTEPDPPIPNPYLAALRQARAVVGPKAEDLRTDLDAVRRAMDNGAWVSTTADRFYTELDGHVRTLSTCADEPVDTIDDAIFGRAEMVDPDSRDGRWRG